MDRLRVTTSRTCVHDECVVYHPTCTHTHTHEHYYQLYSSHIAVTSESVQSGSILDRSGVVLALVTVSRKGVAKHKTKDRRQRMLVDANEMSDEHTAAWHGLAVLGCFTILLVAR